MCPHFPPPREIPYPVHQIADILFCFCKADVVPDGQDQLHHIEQSRLAARRCNSRYIAGTEVFPEPTALINDQLLILGTDRQKMSTSRDNMIRFAASEDETATLTRQTRTVGDPTITYEAEHRPCLPKLGPRITAATEMQR